MITRKSFIDALIAAASWVIGYWIVRMLTQGMEASAAYAMIAGWWFAAYVPSKFNLHISLIVPLFFGSFMWAVVTEIIENEIIENILFYRNAPFLPFLTLLGISLALSLIVCSPIIFDFLFRKIVCICSRICSRKSDSDMGASRWSHDHSM